MFNDPTQPVPPPIDPTREDLIPPPPPLIPAELPYFQAQEAQRERHRASRNRIILALLCLVLVGILAVTLTSVFSSTLFAPQQSGPSPSQYNAWLTQEKAKWQQQAEPIVYAAFAQGNWQVLNVATLDVASGASDMCSQIVNDYASRFHQVLEVHMSDNDNAYVPFTCDG